MTSESLPAIATGFVRKLYRILDQESAAIVAWDDSGASFAILDGDRLEQQVLPRYFRGRLFAFRQQLREHGFQRVAAADGPESYFHEAFRRGCPDRLSAITRTPQPRKRPSRRKAKPTDKLNTSPKGSSVGAAAVVMPYRTAKASHRASPYPVSGDKVHGEHAAPIDVTNNPLFATDEGGALASYLAPMSIDGAKHSLDFAVVPDNCNPLSDAAGEKLSDEAMRKLMSLLGDSWSTDEMNANNAHQSKRSEKNIFESSESGPVVLPPPVAEAPPVLESHQFSSDTMDLMMHWLSGQGGAKTTD